MCFSIGRIIIIIIIYIPTGIEISSPYTLTPLSKKVQIIYIRKDDRIVTKDFIIQRKRILNYINTALLLKQPRNININILKKSPATKFGIFGVIEIGN